MNIDYGDEFSSEGPGFSATGKVVYYDETGVLLDFGTTKEWIAMADFEALFVRTHPPMAGIVLIEQIVNGKREWTTAAMFLMFARATGRQIRLHDDGTWTAL